MLVIGAKSILPHALGGVDWPCPYAIGAKCLLVSGILEPDKKAEGFFSQQC